MGECWGEGGVHRYSVIEHSLWVNVGGREEYTVTVLLSTVCG